ncbi:EAL domain-containing protein [Hydrogenimonas thermophila]|uniref:bifunctional diguanylate cyclase/phosphodiesterase n=2 Tax=Hydrogenimonas thermophila TaxID=223786 RepID=UPI0029373F70|nr:EAL domain-containing protein [Hydrogenimonas thermophila]WOE73281.1 EAL domain-containing protein [Hydrogenimonas thermophila]
MMKINRNSLHFKIILVIVSVLIVFILFFIEDLRLTKEAMERMEQAKVESAIQSNIPSIADAIYFGFEKPIEDIGNMLLAENSNILAILIKTSSGKKYLFKKGKNPFKEKMDNANYKTFYIEKDNKKLGEVEIVYKLILSRQHFNEYRKSAFMFAILIILSIIIAMRYLYKRIKSLNILAEKLRNFDLHNIKMIESPDNYYEVKHITHAVNKLLERINDYARNLKTVNKTLLRNKKRLMDAQRIAQMASWTYWPHTKQVEVSREFYRILEIDARIKNLSIKTILNSIHSDDRNFFINTLKASIDKGSRFDFIHKVVTSRGKIKYLHTEGRVRKFKDAPTEVMGVSMDVTEEIEAKLKAEHMAFHDPLTNLLNRRAFLEKIDFLTKLAKRHKQMLAVLFLDLDNFKFVNDSYGHSVGDELLIKVANILKESIRETDLIARIGGDEFVIVLTDVKDADSAEQIGKNILNLITRNFVIKHHSCTVTASLGIALYPNDATEPETLLQYADAAMYEAKKLGKNRYQFFNSSIRLRLNEHLQIIEEIKEALKTEDQIRLYFQPQIDLSTGKVRGAEVLTRWMHPKKGLIFPNSYIPVIESSSLMAEYDRYVLKMSFKQLYKWSKEKRVKWTLGINLSAQQFNDKSLVDNLKELLKQYPIDPSLIELEITETLQMEDVETSIRMLHEIKNLGFKVSIDDFGTGYSSLSYLKRLPFDVIKIDREFIKDMHQDSEDIIIVKLMIQIAKTLEKEVVAEGPDMEEHIKILEALSCDYAQGYYYSKAIEAKEFEAYAESKK